jgi:hypothetical protein
LSDGRVMLNIRHESEPHLRGVSISSGEAARAGQRLPPVRQPE